jgi:hypothetical protein
VFQKVTSHLKVEAEGASDLSDHKASSLRPQYDFTPSVGDTRNVMSLHSSRVLVYLDGFFVPLLSYCDTYVDFWSLQAAVVLLALVDVVVVGGGGGGDCSGFVVFVAVAALFSCYFHLFSVINKFRIFHEYGNTFVVFTKEPHVIMHVFKRTDFYIQVLNMSYSSTNVCTINGFIDFIDVSIFITSFSPHIQCSLDCMSPDCSIFRVFRTDALNSISFLCSAQNSVEVRMAVCTLDFQTLMFLLSAFVFL